MATTLIEEMTAAARGAVALLRGRRNAPDYFDFSLRGLAGSFIAFITAATFNAVLPVLLGIGRAEGGLGISQTLLMVGMLYVFQVGFAMLVLRQIGRTDGIVPYLVADNWVTFFITILSALMVVLGLSGDLAIIVLGILVIVMEINVARLIVTLTPMQIVFFLLAQLGGVLLGLMLLGGLFPMPLTEGAGVGMPL